MSSRASTEVATGAEARSMRRWLRRAAAPIILRYVAALVLVTVAVLIFGEMLDPPYNRFSIPDSDAKTLLDLIF